MSDDLPFSKVLELLEKHGYRLLKRNKDPDEENAGFAFFVREDSPKIGFPVRNRRVSYEYYQKLYKALESTQEEAD